MDPDFAVGIFPASMKRWKAIALSVPAVFCLGGLGVYVYMQGLGDLRTEYARTEGASAIAQKKGRALLAGSIEELGGVERWGQLREQAVRISFQHTWYHGLLRAFFMPLEFSGQKLSLLVKPGYLDARLTFLDGEWKGRALGLSQGSTYQADSEGAVSWRSDETIRFHLAGYRFFFFLAFCLSEAELVTYAGAHELHGQTYDVVYITWGQLAPHRESDQYLVWVNRETSMIDFVQSTVREMFARSIVALSLSNYREVLGIKLPFSLSVLEDIQVVDGGMHVMEILEVESVKDDGALRPDLGLGAIGR